MEEDKGEVENLVNRLLMFNETKLSDNEKMQSNLQ
jgi:hypothetical protein